MAPNCLSRIILAVLVTVFALGWYVIRVNNETAAEYARCSEDGRDIAVDSFSRAEGIVDAVEALLAGEGKVEETLQTVAMHRADAEGIEQLVSAQATESRCVIPFKPLVRLVDAERELGLDAAELAVVSIRQEQLLAEIAVLEGEAVDYRRRYAESGQKHLLESAQEMDADVAKKSRTAEQIGSLVDSGEQSYLDKKNLFFELAETTFGLSGEDFE